MQLYVIVVFLLTMYMYVLYLFSSLLNISTNYVWDSHLADFLPSFFYLGPVVQSIISLTSSLVVKMLTVLVSTISKSQVFVQQKY